MVDNGWKTTTSICVVWADSLKFEHYGDLSGLPSSTTTVTLFPSSSSLRDPILGHTIATEICGNDPPLESERELHPEEEGD